MFFFIEAVSDRLCVVGLVHILTEIFLLTLKDASLPLLTSALFTYLYPPRSPLTPIARFSVTVKKSFNMPAFINHSNMFPLGAGNALSAYTPASLV